MTVARPDADENAPGSETATTGADGDGGGATAERHERLRQLGLRPGLDGLRDVMDRLLAPAGCAWDRAQTLDSLRPYLVEEAHEVLEAMDDPPRHVGELGDLLFQIVFQSALRQRQGHFDLDDVIASIVDKMIERHPHVFGETAETIDADEVARRWEARKQGARTQGGQSGLGVPRSLPALHRASRLQDKAGALGFDWPTIDGALAKLDEELREFAQAREGGDADAIADELGDVLFVLVRIASKLGLDAETTLARANAKFERRFGWVLEAATAAGRTPQSLGLEGLDALWNEAKRRLADGRDAG